MLARHCGPLPKTKSVECCAMFTEIAREFHGA
jgi:hypothetical protein